MITEYHCCSECKYTIETITNKEISFDCTHPKGEPNPNGGLCRCEYFMERIQ